jgi:hypothetical protein
LQNRLIQTCQTGGQWYSYTSPFSIPWYQVGRRLLDEIGLAVVRRGEDGLQVNRLNPGVVVGKRFIRRRRSGQIS